MHILHIHIRIHIYHKQTQTHVIAYQNFSNVWQVYNTRVKMQGIVIAVEILRFIDGQIDVLLDQSNVVKVYRHEISVTPMTTDLKKIRSILTRGEQGRSEDGKEVLCGENWSMTSNGLTLSIRFSGRHPADAAGLISEPAQPTLDLMADSGASASEFMRMMKMISTYRADAEAAGLFYTLDIHPRMQTSLSLSLSTRTLSLAHTISRPQTMLQGWRVLEHFATTSISIE